MSFIKTFLFLLMLVFTTHSFAKSNEYYRATLVNVLTECKADCKRAVFEQEIQYAFFSLIEAILNQIKFELLEEKKKVWQKSNI
jgi:uncharacterized membrane protein YphA (DoxX/SURF4 family)